MIPIIQKLLEMEDLPRSTKPQPSAIVVLPTQELCLQVYEQAQKFAHGMTSYFAAKSSNVVSILS